MRIAVVMWIIALSVSGVVADNQEVKNGTLTETVFDADVRKYTDDIEKNDAIFKKWGEVYDINPDILKELSMFFSDGNESYIYKMGEEKYYGIMGLPVWEFTQDMHSFITSETSDKDRMDPDLGIHVAADKLASCVKYSLKTPIAIRCYSEMIAKEEAIRIAKMFKKVDKK